MRPPASDAALMALCAEIAAHREGATCDALERVSGLTDRDAADLIAVHCEFAMLGEHWHEIDRAAAVAISAAILSRDLAYGAIVMDAAKAHDYADRFVGCFAEARYYTNGDLGLARADGRSGAGWTPITSATFDTGVIVVGTRAIGILWVQDED